jgi:predicted RND superfamily exporter protein
MREIIRKAESGVLAGEPVMLVDGFRYLEQDGRLLGWTSTILLVAVMLLCFRSIRWVIVPIAVVQLTLLWTRAALVWSGFELSMVSSMLSAIVTIIGVATVVHLIVGFRNFREQGSDPPTALLLAGSLLAWPIIGACATDAVGFGSLILASVGPIQDFGIMMGISSILVLGVVAILVPGLTLLGQRRGSSSHAAITTTWGERQLNLGLLGLARRVSTRPNTWAIATAVFGALAAWGCLNLDVETDFTKNFRASSPVVQSYVFVENRLGGAGVWDVVLSAPEKLDWEYLVKVRRLEQRLRDEVFTVDADGLQTPGLTKVLSLADLVEATIGCQENSPLGPALLAGQLAFLRSQAPQLVEAFYRAKPGAPADHAYRIMLRARERQESEPKKGIIDQVRRIVDEEFPVADVTGFFVLLTYLIDSMINDQWVTFGAASAGIFVMMLVAFRSLRLALVALVPNALPIFMVTGLMGWLDLKINMGAAMIAAVSMGLSIDSSIHYLAAFRRLRLQGRSVQDAVEEVQQRVGRAMVFSTLALVVGFSALCVSEFVPTIYFGALVSLTMLGGLAGNLVVLPLMLAVLGESAVQSPVANTKRQPDGTV